MRIRSIRPEFWSSEDVAAMDWHTRLVYIGLWSYVDDNGVGRDKERLIVAALFPLDDDLPESSRRVTGALRHLSDGGQVTRYEVEGKAYLHVTAWTKHQRIEKASAGRYPLPTCENAEIREGSGRAPGVLPEISTPGEGEKGRRGEGISPASADAERDFDAFWSTYPRKKDKGHGVKAYKAARKRASHDTIMEALDRDKSTTWARRNVEHIPYPATWLNSNPWDDEPDINPAVSRGEYPSNGTPEEQDAWLRSIPRPANSW